MTQKELKMLLNIIVNEFLSMGKYAWCIDLNNKMFSFVFLWGQLALQKKPQTPQHPLPSWPVRALNEPIFTVSVKYSK